MRLRKICPCIPLQNRATLNNPDFEDSLSFDFHGCISRTLRILLHRSLRQYLAQYKNSLSSIVFVSRSRTLGILFHRLYLQYIAHPEDSLSSIVIFSISRTLRILFHRLLRQYVAHCQEYLSSIVTLMYRELYGFSFIDCSLVYRALLGYFFMDCNGSISRTIRILLHRLLRQQIAHSDDSLSWIVTLVQRAL